MINEYVPLLISLGENLNPQQACQLIKLCPTSALFAEQKTEKQKATMKNVDALECDICIQGVTLVDNLLKQNKSEQQVVAALEVFCKVFPSPIKDQVRNFF